MAASNDTVEKILNVVEKHVGSTTILKIFEDLVKVPGNKSFRDTVERLLFRARRRAGLNP
jgi:hypothetical protein